MTRSTSAPPRSRVFVGVGLVIVSMGLAVQGRMNGALVAQTHTPLEVGMLNVVVGLCLGSVVVVVSANRRGRWVRMIGAARSGALRWWEFLGGVAGLALVTLQSGVVALVGVATFSVALVAGQTASGALFDRLGLVTGIRLPVTTLRLAAIAVAVLGVLVAAAGRLSGDGSNVVLAGVLVASVLAGMAASAQAALNGRVAKAAGNPVVAAWASFVVSLLVGGGLMALLVLGGRLDLRPLPLDRPWLLLGGTFGMLYVMAVAWAVAPLGVLLTAILTVVGSLGGALMIDLLAPIPGAPASWQLVLAVAMAALAALLAIRGRHAA